MCCFAHPVCIWIGVEKSRAQHYPVRIVSARFIRSVDREVHINALVTGASGHLGYHICKLLASEGYNVRAFVRPSSFIEHLSELPIEIKFGSVFDAASVGLAMHGIDIVFHAAAVYQLTESRRQPGHLMEDPIVKTAVEGTRVIFSSAVEAGVKKIIFTSSVETVGLSRDKYTLLDESAYSEDDFYVYTIAKIQSESLALALCGKYELPTVVCNPATIIGKYDYKPTPSNQMLLNLVKFNAFCLDGGQSLVDVRDVAQGHVSALKSGRSKERYILGGENIEISDLVRMIRNHLNIKGPFIKLGKCTLYPAAYAFEMISRFTGKQPFFSRAKVDRVVGRYSFYDSSKAQKELGYRPRRLADTLPPTIDWLKKHHK